MLRECPGLLLHSYLLVAEAKLYIHEPSHAHAFFQKAISMEAELDSEARGLLFENWPIQVAVDSYTRFFISAAARALQMTSIQGIPADVNSKYCQLEVYADYRLHYVYLNSVF